MTGSAPATKLVLVLVLVRRPRFSSLSVSRTRTTTRRKVAMKIIDVQGILMSCPLPEPLRLPFWGGERTILKRDAMLIRVQADNGLVGYAPGPAHERAANEIREVIGPFLLGHDPRRWAIIEFQGNLETTKTYRAVEIALIDLAARFEGAALSEMIGGRQ